MLQPSFRIYLSANLVVFLVFAASGFPEGLGFGFLALFFSAFYTSPTLLLLFAAFTLLQRLKPGPAGSWLLLFLAVCTCAFVPQLMFILISGEKMNFDMDFFLLSFGCATGGTLLQGFYLHRYFKSLSPGAASTTENSTAPACSFPYQIK